MIRDVEDGLPLSDYSLDEDALLLVAGGKKTEEDFKQEDEEKN